MTRAIVLATALALALGCKPRPDTDDVRAGLAAMRGFTDKMCACKDKACADQVQAEMTRWGTDMVAHTDRSLKLDATTAKQLSEVGEQYGTCLAAATNGGAGMPLPDPPAQLPLQIDALLRIVRERAAKHPKKLVMSQLEIRYARADGTLDRQYGTLEVRFSVPRTPPPDDPNRPIGAPVPSPPKGPPDSDCPVWTLEGGHWQLHETFCMGVYELTPARCTIAQVWARAIAQEAPPGALATLTLMGGDPQSWQFAISDPPRDIHFRKAYPDDCEPVVEKPAQ